MFRKLFLLCLLVSVLISHPRTSIGDEEEQKKALPQMQQTWEVMPRQGVRPSKHICFLIDSSGSMNGDKIGAAIEFVLNRRTGIAAAPFDDFQIALSTFGSRVGRWVGTTDVNPQTREQMSDYGWSAMPSAMNLQAARTWISNNLDGQGTNVIPGLRHCFRSNSGVATDLAGLNRSVSINQLTIIVITDGDFSEPRVDVIKAIQALQKERRDKNLPEALIGFVGIGVTVEAVEAAGDTGHTRLTHLARQHGTLGYLRVSFIEEEDEDD